MKLYLSKGKGTGPTELASFDNALYKAGINNLNLLPLSSVIPPNSEIVLQKPKKKFTYGDKAYIVMSSQTTSKLNETVCAGIGWVQSKNDKSGLFVEIHGTSKATVKREIIETLNSMRKYRSKEFGKINMVLQDATCTKEPVCAFVSAFYQSEGWENEVCKTSV